MLYYAYVPNKKGNEPLGTENKLIMRDLKTDRGAIRRALRYLGPGTIVYRYHSDHLYDDTKRTRIFGV